MKRLKPVFGLSAISLAILGCAGASPASAADNTQNTAYIGIAWTFGISSLMPDGVVGWRQTRTSASSDMTGVDASARFKLTGTLTLDSIRTVYLNGDRSSYANVGVGYSLTNRSIFGTVGASVERARIGADFHFGPSTPSLFLELNTLKKPDPAVAPAGAPATGGGVPGPGPGIPG